MSEPGETAEQAASRLILDLTKYPRVVANELRELADRLEEEARRLRVWANGLETS